MDLVLGEIKVLLSVAQFSKYGAFSQVWRNFFQVRRIFSRLPHFANCAAFL